MNLRVALPLTMLISFTLTCGFLVWDRRTREPAARTIAPPPPANTGPAPPANTEPRQSLSLAVEPPPSESRAPASPPESRAASQAEPSDHAKLELPIDFNYRHSPGSTETYVVYLVSKAQEAMALDVIVFNPTSKRTVQSQLNIETMQLKKIGVDDNLEIEQGDRITLHNPAYNDFVAEVRPR